MPDRKSRACSSLLDGLVVASHGRGYVVELAGYGELDCVTRGKRGGLVCGDRVAVALGAPGQGVIEAAAPRASLLYRTDASREKIIAANVTQVIVVAAEHRHMAALIVLNKVDLPESAAALESLDLYRRIGYRVLALSARHDIQPLQPLLQDHVRVLVGQAGMGKSTIINRLLPQAAARTGEISRALGSGRRPPRRRSFTTST